MINLTDAAVKALGSKLAMKALEGLVTGGFTVVGTVLMRDALAKAKKDYMEMDSKTTTKTVVQYIEKKSPSD